ncbi:MAG: ABC transporter ATP-binding protein [Anaerolineae bacterium]|nr:ABC transporter ATP-binding protein [Anaerolineae bacterium]
MDNRPVSIHVRHLTRTYPGRGRDKQPVIANDNLSFEVRRGEIFGLLGANGAGKTTLIYQLMGLMQPDAGEISLEGIDVIRTPDKVKQIVGFLPQTGLPMRYVEVERALHYTGRLRGQTDTDARQQARLLIDELGIGDHAQRFVNKLSGGMLRLANFAMALMGWPQVLILDEPTNELDPHKRRVVWEMIARLNRERGVTCILVTHNVLEAERVIQHVAVMKAGRIVAQGTPGALKLYTGAKVRLEFRLKDGEQLAEDELHALAALGTVDSTRQDEYCLHLQPETVSAATDSLMNRIGLARLDDFRLAPPTLEEVYLEFDSEQQGVSR